MLLMIDNYDSFTYNVVQYLAELGADVHVFATTKSRGRDRGAGAGAYRDLAGSLHTQ
jgi:anthranilate/para-aminobenzoate synthase component II